MEQKSNIVYIANPFDPVGSRIIYEVSPDQTISKHLETLFTFSTIKDGCELKIKYKDQFIEDLDTVVEEGEYLYLVVVPEGDNFGLYFAMAILAVATWGVGAYVGAGIGAVGGLGWSSATVFALQAGMMIAGGLLISAMFRPSVPSSDLSQDSATYGWGVGQNEINEGGRIPVLYGKHKITPYMIGRYVDIDDNGNEFLNALYALTDHQLDQVSNIKLNDIPIEDYEEAHVDIRMGMLDQEPIHYFSDTRKDSIVGSGGMKLGGRNDDWVTFTSTGNDVNGLRIAIVAPKGFCHISKEGDVNFMKAELHIEYRVLNTGNWIRLKDTVINQIEVNTGHWSLGYFSSGVGRRIGATRSTYLAQNRNTNASPNWNTEHYFWVEVSKEFTAFDAREEGEKYTLDDKEDINMYGGSQWLTWRWINTGVEIHEIEEKVDHVVFEDNVRNRTARMFNTPLLQAKGTYEVRVKVDKWYWRHRGTSSYGKDSISEPIHTRRMTELVFSFVQEVTTGYDYSYPGTALIALRSLATDKLSGNTPRMTVEAERAYLDGYNQSLNATYISGNSFSVVGNYTGTFYKGKLIQLVGTGSTPFNFRTTVDSVTLSGSNTVIVVNNDDTVSLTSDLSEVKYGTFSAKNPAYICYDMLTNPYYGGGYDPDKIVAQDFLDWGAWCDEPLSSWETGSWCTEGLEYPTGAPKYQSDIYFDTDMTLKEACDTVGLLGRGGIIQLGNKFSCYVEKPSDESLPVQRFLFTIGNIISDSFSMEFLPMDNRCNCIEVTFWDEEVEYDRQMIEIFAPGADDPEVEERKTAVSLIGCSRRDIAIRHGMYLLNTARYLTITASWEASIDSIHCHPGDLVEIQHDVPQWGFGGRIVAVDGSNITLDREVEIFADKSYALKLKNNADVTQTVNVTNAVGKHTVLTVTGLTLTLQKYNLYSFGEVNTEVMLMRIIRITRAEGFKRRIEAIEHIDEVFDDCKVIPRYEPVSALENKMKYINYVQIWNTVTKKVDGRLYWEGDGPEFEMYARIWNAEKEIFGPWVFVYITKDKFLDVPDLPIGFRAEVAVKVHNVVSNTVTVDFTYTGITETAQIELLDLQEPKIYFNMNEDGSVTHARFECVVDSNETEIPDGIALMYSVDAIPNRLQHIWVGADTGLGYDLFGIYLQENDILYISPEGVYYPIIASSDAYTMVVTTADDPIGGESGGGTFDGSFWVSFGRNIGQHNEKVSKWNQVHYYTDTSLIFKEPFVDQNNVVMPTLKDDVFIFGQLTWKDIREPEWRLGYVFPVDPSNGYEPLSTEYEVVRYQNLTHDTFGTATDYWYIDQVQRAKEGTTKRTINKNNIHSLYYYPSFGPGSHLIILEANKFVHVGEDDYDWKFSADTNLNIPILNGMWGAITCMAYKFVAPSIGNPTGILRSNIIPVSYGGGI